MPATESTRRTALWTGIAYLGIVASGLFLGTFFTPVIVPVTYTILEDVEKAVKGMLAPVYREVQDATIEVRQIFRLGRRNAIAGCYVREGTAVRNSQCRVMRGNDVIHEGRIDSLKRIDEDAREVAAGLECGIMVTNFTDFEEGDNIVTFHQEQVR